MTPVYRKQQRTNPGKSYLNSVQISISEYISIHSWLSRHHGSPKHCVHCLSTTEKRYEWAIKKGCKYEKNIDNYLRLCKKCHHKYDGQIGMRRSESTRKKISNSKIGNKNTLGHKLTEEHKNKIANSMAKKLTDEQVLSAHILVDAGMSFRKVALEFNTSHSVISKSIERLKTHKPPNKP